MEIIMRISHFIKTNLAIAAMVISGLAFCHTAKADDEAKMLDANITLSNGSGTGNMTDDSYGTHISFKSGDKITISSTEKIHGIYIKWDQIPDSYSVGYNGNSVNYGTKGFLHEFIEIAEGTNEATITFNSSEAICNLSVFGSGKLPDNVQNWKSPADGKADILVFATHADDEILFLGGVLSTYAGEQKLNVQVAYMCEFNSTAKVREHEKLDGLWYSGVTLYPVCGDFTDLYSETLEAAKKQYDFDEIKAYTTSCIRRFKPQVVVTQDLKGEYGHGGHQIYTKAVQESVDSSNDANAFSESASKYGVWDVPKVYFHLYEQNPINMNLRTPLSNMGGRTALEVAVGAYKEHVSQQWCWFYVSDEYEYSCAKFGLYKTNVGTDKNNDMMENITSYAEQDRIAEEAKKKAEEEASIEAEKASSKEVEKQSESKKSSKSNTLLIVLIVIVIILLIAGGALYIRYKQVQRERKRRARQRAAARRKNANSKRG